MTKLPRTLHLLLALIIINGTGSAVCSEAVSSNIVETVNMASDGQESTQTNKPILLLVSRTRCPYCTQIKREILEPMIISGDYRNKIIIRELNIKSANIIRDFDGAYVKASKIADKYRIKVTPTLLFLGPKGVELADRIVGINTLELFSYYVDQAIDEAALKLHSK